MEWHGEKVLNTWRKGGAESQDSSRNLSVIRKQSCPSSVEINISCFSPNTYSTRMMKMIPNTAKQTLDWFQRKRIKLLERPDNHLTRIQ